MTRTSINEHEIFPCISIWLKLTTSFGWLTFTNDLETPDDNHFLKSGITRLTSSHSFVAG